MKELKHPLTRATYGVDPDHDGLVKVEDGDRIGWFTHLGEWRAGARFQVDPELCNWVGGPDVATDRSKPWKQV